MCLFSILKSFTCWVVDFPHNLDKNFLDKSLEIEDLRSQEVTKTNKFNKNKDDLYQNFPK